MIAFLIKILIITILLILVVRLAAHIVFGGLLLDKDSLKSLEDKINKGNNELNHYNSDIINVDNLFFISDIGFDILCKYHIDDVGTIPRWSKAHTLIDNEFKRLKKEKLDNLLK